MHRQGTHPSRLKMSRPVRLLCLLGLAAAVSGCAGANSWSGAQATKTGQTSRATMASWSGGTQGAQTVTFESIDGPPQQVFDRFVRLLDTESQTRNIAIVSRSSTAAHYRIRSYLAAHVRSGRTSIAWVWDVYDRDQQRTLRLSGEESAGKPGRDAWAVADEPLLRRIAQSGLSTLAGFVNGNGTAPSDGPSEPQAPIQAGPAIAWADEIPADGIIGSIHDDVAAGDASSTPRTALSFNAY